jgi:hypothetical protein
VSEIPEDSTVEDEDLKSLDTLEYPYNQEFSHQVAWSPLDEYIESDAEGESLSLDSATANPSSGSKMAPESVDYPYNQDWERLVETNSVVDNNGAWKEAEMFEFEEPHEHVDVGVDYPYNQLFGGDNHGGYSETAAKHGTVDEKVQDHQINTTENTRPTVQHIVHSGEDVLTHSTSPDQKDHSHFKHSHPHGTSEGQHVHGHLKPSLPQGTSLHHVSPSSPEFYHQTTPHLSLSKIDQRLMKEFEHHKSHFSPVGVSKKDHGVSVAKESPDDGVGYERYDDKLTDTLTRSTALPAVPLVRCSYTGYYQNPKDCTQFVACLFDHNTRTKVLHLMRCPAGLVWDNLRKLCMQSSTTCQQSRDHTNNYFQYLAQVAAVTDHHYPRSDVTLNLVKTKNKNSHV